MRHRLAEAIDIDIVIAGAVHLGETHGPLLLLRYPPIVPVTAKYTPNGFHGAGSSFLAGNGTQHIVIDYPIGFAREVGDHDGYRADRHPSIEKGHQWEIVDFRNTGRKSGTQHLFRFLKLCSIM